MEQLFPLLENKKEYQTLLSEAQKLFKESVLTLTILEEIKARIPFINLLIVEKEGEHMQFDKERKAVEKIEAQVDQKKVLDNLIYERISSTCRYPYEHYFSSWLSYWVNMYDYRLKEVKTLETVYRYQEQAVAHAQQTYNTLSKLARIGTTCRELREEINDRQRDEELQQTRAELQNLHTDFSKLNKQYTDCNNHLSHLQTSYNNLQYAYTNLQSNYKQLQRTMPHR